MINVFGNPTPDAANRNSSNGIAQVVLNLAEHLPDYGYKLVNHEKQADLIAHHAGSGEGHTDVAHCHGLYPTGEKGYVHSNVHKAINDRVIADLLAAKEITVPSEWVADILRFEFGMSPHVIGWSVDTHHFSPPERHKNYVLWNKNRVEGVCNPEAMNVLARQNQTVKFISTFGNQANNVQLTGLVSHDKMASLVRHAGIYLATTPETGDIGSREALACGVPVLGFRHGALPDIVRHGVNGFLAEPGDLEGLHKGLQYCLKNRAVLSHNARKLIQDDGWGRVAEAFAGVYDLALNRTTEPLISVIIPCYNYADKVSRAIRSVLGQECSHSVELIVINDGSTDNSHTVIDALQKEHGFTYINQTNAGVAHARNAGINAAKGQFIACMDADDQMAQGFLQVTADALLNNPQLGIAYTGLFAIHGEQQRESQWPGEFDLTAHLHGHNQVPSLCLFRKVAWQRTGGYRQRYHPAEDARLWLDMVELGWQAKKVTPLPLFVYDMHADSASRAKDGGIKPQPNWRDNKGYMYNGDVPGGMGGTIINRDPPLVSIIIPVGGNHAKELPLALDSVWRQSERSLECLVINDTGEPLSVPSWVKVYDTPEQGSPARARNIGLDHARGYFVVFLDADDVLYPTFLTDTIKVWQRTGRYVYTEYKLLKDGDYHKSHVPDFNQLLIFDKGMYHPITCLLPRPCIGKLRFDEALPTWEDFDFFMSLHERGVCGQALRKELFLYRMDTGTMRNKATPIHDELLDYLYNVKHKKARRREVAMCGCNKRRSTASATIEAEQVMIEYHPERRKGGITAGRHDFYGIKINGKHHVYRNVEPGSRFTVFRHDYEANQDIFDVAQDYAPAALQTAIPNAPEYV